MPRLLLLAIILLALLTACGDVVEKTYATKAQARADELFDKGWLPDFIPEGVVELRVINNLDLNSSTGSFRFPPLQWPAFAGHLQADTTARAPFVGWQEELADHRKRGFPDLYYEEDGAVWVFFCNAARGQCEYAMWVRRE